MKKSRLNTGLTQLEAAEKLGVAQNNMLDGKTGEKSER
jgi:hypothetical protein